MIGQDMLRRSWNAFVSLLDIDYKGLMLCTECGKFPDTIILDGHSLGLRKHLLKEVAQEAFTASAAVVLEGSRHDQRQLVSTQKTRDTLLRFATGKDKNGREAFLTQHEYFELIRNLCDSGVPALAKVVKRAKENDKYQSKAGYKALLRECARNTPVVGIIPLAADEDTRQRLDDIVNSRQMQK